MEFMIGGWVNPSIDDDTFVITMSIVREITTDSVTAEYVIEKFEFAELQVVANEQELYLETDSTLAGDSPVELEFCYELTRILPYGAYFELTIPPINIGFCSDVKAKPSLAYNTELHSKNDWSVYVEHWSSGVKIMDL